MWERGLMINVWKCSKTIVILSLRRKMWSTARYELEDYKPPPWAQGLKHLPQYKLKLANTPTPVQPWHLPGVPDGFQLFLKRDDMTGSTLSGNKIRKLEFILADVLKKGYKNIITLGAAQSNHVRTTVLAARQVGLDSHVILRTKAENVEDIPIDGNLLLNLLGGASVYFVGDNKGFYADMQGMMDRLAAEIKESTGQDSYTIPLGASTVLGTFGYFEAYNELLNQGVQDNVTDIVVTTGSGGTLAGIAIGNHLALGDKIKVHGICIGGYSPDYFYDHIDQMLQELGLGQVKARDIAHIVWHKGLGYGINTEEDFEFVYKVSESTGIVLDGAYTGKGARGMLKELNENPSQFKGNQILFLHTGGIFGNLSQEKTAGIVKASDYKSTWKMWDPN